QIPLTVGGACYNANIAVPGSCGPLTVYPSEILAVSVGDNFMSHEVTFLSPGSGPVKWIAGVYYYRDHTFNFFNVHSNAPIGSVEEQRIDHPSPLSGPTIADQNKDP